MNKLNINKIEDIDDKVIKNYFIDMLFNNFEGFDKKEIKIIKILIKDIIIYDKNDDSIYYGKWLLNIIVLNIIIIENK